jgi:preprotein translocase subunit SecF
MATERAASTAPQRVGHRFLELIPPDLGIDFVRLTFRMLGLSWALIGAGLVSMYLQGGLNYGIDFSGGTMVHVRFPQAATAADIRAALAGGGLREVLVQDVGQGGAEFQIRAQESEGATGSAADVIKAGLNAKFGEGTYDVLRVEAVGPKVGQDLWWDATLAVMFSTLVMGVYITMRFDWRFGIGAAVALVHDVLMTLAFLSFFRMEFDLTTVAALLTVVGYSVHDTVIVSDRIRENLARLRKESLATIINLSINETLSRTIITSGTAVLVTVALFVLGGPVIHSFAFTLMIGFIVGTYSSIYVASPIVLYLERRGERGRRHS